MDFKIVTPLSYNENFLKLINFLKLTKMNIVEKEFTQMAIKIDYLEHRYEDIMPQLNNIKNELNQLANSYTKSTLMNVVNRIELKEQKLSKQATEFKLELIVMLKEMNFTLNNECKLENQRTNVMELSKIDYMIRKFNSLRI